MADSACQGVGDTGEAYRIWGKVSECRFRVSGDPPETLWWKTDLASGWKSAAFGGDIVKRGVQNEQP